MMDGAFEGDGQREAIDAALADLGRSIGALREILSLPAREARAL